MSIDALALRNLCLWCEFQSHLLFIISLLLKNFLTALPAAGLKRYHCYARVNHISFKQQRLITICMQF